MAERIAAAEIYVGVRDDEAIANLRRIQATFDRTMDDIDRTKAEADVGANLAPLKDDLANAKRMLRQLEGAAANPDISMSDADKAKLKKDILAAKRLVKQLDGEVATVEIEVHGEREAIKAQQAVKKATQDRFDAEEKMLRDIERTRDAAARRQSIRVQREARVRESLNRQRVRELDADERAAYQRERELNSIPKLEQAYVGLHHRLEKLAETRRKMRRPYDEAALLRIGVEERSIVADIEAMRAKIQAIAGRDPIDIPVKPELGRRWGEILRSDIIRHQGNWFGVGGAVGLRIGDGMRGGIRRSLDRGLGNVAKDAGRTLGGGIMRSLATAGTRVAHAAAGLADSTVRIGPFTTTIRKAVIGMSLFAPIILDVVGALGALTGSVGSATLGLGALVTAAAGGGIPTFLGMGIVVKQVASEFSNVMKAQKAYDDAMRKGNTELAATKMKELKAVMGNVSKETVHQIGMARKLNGAWKEATQPARAAVWSTIGEAIQTASDLMPQFAQRTNSAMKVASRGVNEWMQRLRSKGGREALFEMMDNFRKSMGPVLKGLGDVGAYLGRVGQIASRALPGMARNFRDWAHELNSVDTKTLTDKVEKTIDSLRALGRFLMAAGRMLKAFFGAGVDSGNDLLDVMTNAMNDWTAWMNTVEGQKSLDNFFHESVEGARTLWNTLQPVITSFVRWAANMAPFVRSFFDGAAAVGDLVAEVLKLTGLRAPVAALATTLGALWALGKIRAATEAIIGFSRALFGLQAANTAAGASGLLGMLTGRGGKGLSTVAKVGAGTAIADMTLDFAALGNGADDAGRKVGRSRGFLATLGSTAAKVAPSLLRIGTVAGIAGTAALLFGGEAENAADKARELAKASEDLADSANAGRAQSARTFNVLADATTNMKSGRQELHAAQREVDRLTRAGKTGSAEYAAALQRLNTALSTVRESEKARARAMDAVRSVNRALTGSTQGVTKATEAQNKAVGEATRWIKDNENEQVKAMTGKNIWELQAEDIVKYGDKLPIIEGREDDFADAVEATKDAMEALTEARESDIKAAQQQMVNAANLQRGLKGFHALGQKAGQVMVDLAKQIGGKKTMEIAVKFPNPRQASAVMRAMNAAIASGAPKNRAFNVVANSKTAEDALRRLNRIKITPKKLDIIQKGGPEALKMIRQITGTKMPEKVQRIITSDRSARAKIKALIDMGIPPKTAKLLADPDRAKADINAVKAMKIADKITTVIARVSQATSGINSVIGLLNSVPRSITSTITTIRKSVTKADGGYAGGGTPSGARPDARKQERAAQTAGLSGVGRAISQKVNRPRYLVGEEATPEIVVSTNPRYRERNQKYAAMAARMVGLQVVGAADGFDGIIPAAKGFFPDLKFPPSKPGKVPSRKRTPRKKRKKARKKAYKRGRDWNQYIERLFDRQTELEREVSIRESQIEEPEDLIVEVGRLTEDGVDEDGKKIKVDLGPKMEVNQTAIDAYQASIDYVLKAYDSLRAVVNKLFRTLPAARKAFNREKVWRQSNAGVLRRRINADEKVLGRRKASKDAKKSAKKRLDKNRPRLAAEERVIQDINDDLSTFRDDYEEAGFDLREIDIARAEMREDRDAITGEAKEQRDQANDVQGSSGGGSFGGGSDGGGGGGAAEGGLSYGQQAALADTEKANVLRDFGSNFNPNTGGTPGGVGKAGAGAGQGMQSNIASLASFGSSGSGVAATYSGAAARSAGAAAGAVSGGGVGGVTALSGGGGATTIEGDKTVNVYAEFAEVPPDPHTFVKGVEFEAGSVI